jgi:hypothetical protein
MLNPNAKSMMTALTSVAGQLSTLTTTTTNSANLANTLGAGTTRAVLDALLADLNKHLPTVMLLAKAYQDADHIAE